MPISELSRPARPMKHQAQFLRHHPQRRLRPLRIRKIPVIVGAILGVVIFLLIVLLIFILCRRRSKKRTATSFGDRMVRNRTSPPWLHNMLARAEKDSEDGSTVTIETVSTSGDLDTETKEDLSGGYHATEVDDLTETAVSISTDTPSVLPPGFMYPMIIATPASPPPSILYVPRTA